MYTELSDSGFDMPPMAPFAVRESNLTIGRGDTRGGYTQPNESREPMAPMAPMPQMAPQIVPQIVPQTAPQTAQRVAQEECAGEQLAALDTFQGRQVPQSMRVNPFGYPLAARNRGSIAPVSPMLGIGTEMPLAVFVVLVLNFFMMLLCALALLTRGAR